MLIPLPSLAKTYVMPSGKVMEEKITYHHTLSGLQVAVSQWVEVLGAIKKAEASEDSQEDVIKNYIRSLSDLAGIDGDFMIKLADCESGFNPDAKGDFRGKIYMAHGLFQWWEKSWKHYNKIYKTDLNRELWTDQVKRSVEVVRDYGSDDWLNCRNFIKTGSWDFLKK